MLLCEKNESAGDKAGHADKRTRVMVTEGKIKRGKVVVRVRGKRTKAEMRVHLRMKERR